MTFVDELVAAGTVSREGLATLRRARASTREQVYALVAHFPGLDDLDTAGLSATTLPGLDAAFVAAVDLATEEAPAASMSLGALPPDGSLNPDNDSLTSVSSASLFSAPLVAGPNVSVILNIPWPVRDQWRRGTCVAHAVVALAEHLNAGVSMPDYSEQFLFAHAKIADGQPQTDGSWIEFGANALKAQGVCDELSLRYNPTPVTADIGHVSSLPQQSPRIAAKHPTSTYKRLSRPTPSGVAATLYGLLSKNRRPVAISVPIFFDTVKKGSHNWNTRDALDYGEVMDPLRGMIAKGGHAVCVTGYVGDPSALGGGWFVFRNSWGDGWARLAAPGSQPGRPSPAIGYGALSADYIDRFLWEYCQL